jgi:two-component system chemotaxis response regulator CheY
MNATSNEAERVPSGITALIVDDSAVARSILGRALRLSGLPITRVLEASDGQKGLDLLLREDVSFALVDLNMPVMGGMEMLERARASAARAKTPIVVVSTEGSDVQIARVRSLGAGFLRKPYTPESLVDAVQAIFVHTRDRAVDEKLFRVSAHVLAELCFLLPEDGCPDPLPPEELMVSVRYSGSSTGQLSLGFAGLNLAEIAGDMMGVPPDEAMAPDAALELANVVCGHALPVMYGAEKVFQLSAPRLGVAPVPEEPLVAEAVLNLRGGHIRARFHGKAP